MSEIIISKITIKKSKHCEMCGDVMIGIMKISGDKAKRKYCHECVKRFGRILKHL